MTTLTKPYLKFSANMQSITLASRYDQFIKKIEFSHFGIIAKSILIASCLGSITTMYIFENNGPLWEFIISLGFTMANLVACIGMAPTKWVVNLFTVNVFVNVILLIVNIH